MQKLPKQHSRTQFLFTVFLGFFLISFVNSSELRQESLKTVSVRANNDTKYFRCRQVDNDQDYYLCTVKEYQWVLNVTDPDYERDRNVVECEIEADDQVKQKVIAQVGQIFFILVNVTENQQLNLSYIGLSYDLDEIRFKTITIPDSLKSLESQLPNILHNQIKQQFGRFRTNLGTQALVLIAVLLVIIGFIYWFKKGKTDSTIDKQPTELKEVLNAKIQIQKEQKRVPSVGLVRASQPPPTKPKI